MIFIDRPTNRTVSSPVGRLEGWAAVDQRPERVEIEIGDMPFAGLVSITDRPDVAKPWKIP